MAVTITAPAALGKTRATFAVGPVKHSIRDVAFSGSYAAGGETITPAQVGLHAITNVYGIVTEGAAAGTALPVRYDRVNSKLQMYEAAAAGSPGAEKGNEAYAANTQAQLTFVGT
jgi:hypothetical protein